jgi:hypothetical protein
MSSRNEAFPIRSSSILTVRAPNATRNVFGRARYFGKFSFRSNSLSDDRQKEHGQSRKSARGQHDLAGIMI